MVLFRAVRAAGYALLTVAYVTVRTYDRAKRIGRALLPRRREDAFCLTQRRDRSRRER